MAHPQWLAPCLARSRAHAHRNPLPVRARPGPPGEPLQKRLFLAPPKCSGEYRGSPRFLRRIVIGIWPMAMDLLREGAVPQRELHPIVVRLKAWRERNELTPRQAAAVLRRYNVPVAYSTLRGWESGGRPRELMVELIARVLEEHPTITDPPRFGRWVKDE
jgi:DNA-binding transcriptional regulator YiaG